MLLGGGNHRLWATEEEPLGGACAHHVGFFLRPVAPGVDLPTRGISARCRSSPERLRSGTETLDHL